MAKQCWSQTVLESGSWGHSVLQTPALVIIIFYFSEKTNLGFSSNVKTCFPQKIKKKKKEELECHLPQIMQMVINLFSVGEQNKIT